MAPKFDPQLPRSLQDAWMVGSRDAPALDSALENYTASQLCKNFLQFQIDRYLAAKPDQRDAPSLRALSIGSVLDVLESNKGRSLVLNDELKNIVESLTPSLLKQVILDPRLSYAALRLLCFAVNSEAPDLKTELPDIDELILRQERYIRSRSDEYEKYYVRLEDLPAIIPMCSVNKSNILTIKRPDLPKGGFEILDYWRKQDLKVHASDKSYLNTFDRITKNALKGLDWSNVFMAGGMALTSLLHTDDSKDANPDLLEPDIDLYLHGLSVGAANAKVEHIYETWKGNLPSNAKEHLVVKNAKTITFLPTFPHRRIQIVLKLVHAPLDVLLNFDLDASAIGFDGTHVVMLPRFARALETGYSVFSMDLIWGHHLRDRRATQETRVFKYANRGFGLRFLPTYMRSLERGTKTSKQLDSFKKQYCSAFEDELPHRYPYGNESGLKTFKRISYVGKDYVHRYLFGVTPLAVSPEVFFNNVKHDKEWTAEYQRAEKERSSLIKSNEEARRRGLPCAGPVIHLSDLAGEDHFRNLPDGRRGLGNLEIFMRLCEAWELDAKADASIMPRSTASLAYDDVTYDDQPTYKWNRHFKLDTFREDIELSNSQYWTKAKTAIAQKVNIPPTTSGFTDYSSRRLRRYVVADSLHDVMEKQLTIPVAVPFDFEDYVLNQLPNKCQNLPDGFTEPTPCLIPLFNDNYSLNFIPPLQDMSDESGNLRFWVITNSSMWASQSRAVDELFEILWSLFHWLMNADPWAPENRDLSTSSELCIQHLARSFRRRIVLPEVDPNEELGPGLPTKREALLFRAWALRRTPTVNTDFVQTDRAHQLFFDGAVKWPFDDKLFWKGDEKELGIGK